MDVLKRDYGGRRLVGEVFSWVEDRRRGCGKRRGWSRDRTHIELLPKVCCFQDVSLSKGYCFQKFSKKIMLIENVFVLRV